MFAGGDDILQETTPTIIYKNNQLGGQLITFNDEQIKILSPTCVLSSKKNAPLTKALNPTETINVKTPNVNCKLQSSSYSANIPDVTPKAKNLISKINDFAFSKIKPNNFYTATSLNTNNLYRLKKIVAYQNKLLTSKRVLISKLKKKLISSTLQNRHNKSVNCMNLLKFPSEDSKTLVGMQITRNGLSTKSWSQKEQEFALSLFYKSPSTYKFLRNSKKIILPGITTVKRWIENYNFCPEFNAALYEQLKTEADSMTEQENNCTLVVQIKHFLE